MSKANTQGKAKLEEIETRIKDEAEKLEKAQARLHQLDARKSYRARQEEARLARRERTHRLILIGAVMVAKAEKEEDFKACLMKWLDEGIMAERDRALFDLGLPQTQD